MQLSIIGTGVKSGDISLNAYEKLKSGATVVLRTEKTASTRFLKENKIEYLTLDYLYEKSKNFDTLLNNIVNAVKTLLKENDVCYLVDGAVSEDSASARLIEKIKDVNIYEGVSKVGYIVSLSNLSGQNYTAVSAYSLDKFTKVSLPLVIYDLDNVLLASEWKLKLFSLVGEDVKVRLYARNRQFLLPMYEIDGIDGYDYSTVLVIDKTPLEDKERFDYDDLYEIVKRLRAPNGCPWDAKQTKETICRSLIEECYELVDAVKKGSDEKICEETGDVLLQTAFYINFLEEDLSYDKSDVLTGICSKLIMRHSHVFGSDKAANAEEALAVWNKNKQIEKGYESSTSYLDDVPKNLPAALRAEKVIKRAKYCNYSVGDKDKLIGGVTEVLDKISNNSAQKEDLKQLLFKIIALVKNLDESPEDLIASATYDFIDEFSKVESKIKSDGLHMKDLDIKGVEKYRNGN